MTFVIWGIMHGIFLSFEVITQNFRKRLMNYLGRNSWVFRFTAWIFVFLLFTLSQIFARAHDLEMATEIIERIVTGFGPTPYLDYTSLVLGIGFLVFVLLSDVVKEYGLFDGTLLERYGSNYYLNSVGYSAFIFIIIMFSANSTSNFIYFQF